MDPFLRNARADCTQLHRYARYARIADGFAVQALQPPRKVLWKINRFRVRTAVPEPGIYDDPRLWQIRVLYDDRIISA